MLRRLLIVVAAPLALGAVLYAAAQDYVEAAAFVVRAAEMGGLAGRAAALEAQALREHTDALRWRDETLRARIFEPQRVGRGAVLLVPGVHAGGIDEPRLVHFAREIAAAGHRVVTVELPDLARYEITPRTTDMIEAAGDWVAREWNDGHDARARPVGIIGISFGGGLAVVAAARLKDRVGWVLSFGGHGDLPRTLQYLCTGIEPDGSERPPHDYGVAVILLGVADLVVPSDQVEPLRRGILTFLEASHLDMTDKDQAAAVFREAHEMAAAMDEPARTYMGWVNARDVGQLGPALLPHLGALAGDPALSPERHAPPSAPVYLLHGADDNVIPAVESELLAAALRRQGTRVTQLATPLITHAELDRRPGPAEVWRLVRFWAGPM